MDANYGKKGEDPDDVGINDVRFHYLSCSIFCSGNSDYGTAHVDFSMLLMHNS